MGHKCITPYFSNKFKFNHLEKEMIGKNGISLNVCYFFYNWGLVWDWYKYPFINVDIFSFFAYYFHDWLLTLEIPFHHSIYQSRKMSGSEPFARIEYRKNIGCFLTILVKCFSF